MANIHLPTTQRPLPANVGADEHLGGDWDAAVTGATALDAPVADLAVNTDNRALVATHYGRDAVSILDPAGLTVAAVVPLGGDPFTAAVTRDHAYVSTISLRNEDAVEVVELSSGSVVATYPQSATITAIAAGPDGKRVFVGRTEFDRVDIAVIDTSTGEIDTIDAGWGPAINIDALHVAGNGRRVYAAVSDDRSSHLVIVNVETGRIEGAVGIGAPIRDIAVGPDHTAYVLTSDRYRGGSVAVVDLYRRQIRERIDIGGAPTQLALAADGARAYIVDYDSVAVLCTASSQIVHTFDTGVAPSCVAVSADSAQLFIADYTGEVTSFAVADISPLLYSPFLATNPIPGRRVPAEVA
ncbi:YncE family protein [Mycolicibacterium thermoresistibile]